MLLSQPKRPITTPTVTPTAPSSSRLMHKRKPSAKQASQNRCTIEKQSKKKAKLARKPKTINMTQIDDFELLFRKIGRAHV